MSGRIESFDHVLRCDEGIQAKVDYICQNPVRKGLVASERDYPWTSARRKRLVGGMAVACRHV